MKNLTFEELLDKLEKALARIEALEKENKLLREENAMLRARLNMNSSNSSLPPSSDRFIKKKIDLLERKVIKLLEGKLDIKVLLLIKLKNLILLLI
jgi:cell shape-determining protein MreC